MQISITAAVPSIKGIQQQLLFPPPYRSLHRSRCASDVAHIRSLPAVLLCHPVVVWLVGFTGEEKLKIRAHVHVMRMMRCPYTWSAKRKGRRSSSGG